MCWEMLKVITDHQAHNGYHNELKSFLIVSTLYCGSNQFCAAYECNEFLLSCGFMPMFPLVPYNESICIGSDNQPFSAYSNFQNQLNL